MVYRPPNHITLPHRHSRMEMEGKSSHNTINGQGEILSGNEGTFKRHSVFCVQELSSLIQQTFQNGGARVRSTIPIWQSQPQVYIHIDSTNNTTTLSMDGEDNTTIPVEECPVRYHLCTYKMNSIVTSKETELYYDNRIPLSCHIIRLDLRYI